MLEILKVGHCWHPEAMILRNCSLKKMQFPAYVGLLQHPSKGFMLFDTGYAKRFIDETHFSPEIAYRWITPMQLGCKEHLISQLSSKGIAPSDIKYIFISHFHADHISGLLDFPDAKYLCSKLAYQDIIQRGRLSGLLKGYLKKLIPLDFHKRCIFIEELKKINLLPSLSPFIDGYDIFRDGSLIAISLPGHAAGQYGLFCVDSEQGIFLVGDAAWTKDAYEKNIYPNPLAYLIMESRKRYIETLDNLSQLYASGHGIKIIPSHCEISAAEYISSHEDR
ncbi:MAG: MBL fold metallo-hydrolase [Pseudomonadota bacterium]